MEQLTQKALNDKICVQSFSHVSMKLSKLLCYNCCTLTTINEGD